jgi:hypothetical protein
MAGLLCICGNGMSNSEMPSENIAEIYTKDALEKAIAEKVELIDLWNDNWEYWFCPLCKRVTVVNRKTRRYTCSYSCQNVKSPVTLKSLQGWEEIFFWHDKDFVDATEASPHVTVKDFMVQHPSRYLIRLSPDKSVAHVFSSQDGQYLFCYAQDPKELIYKD